MRTKKIASVLLCLALLLSTAACAQQQQAGDSSAQSPPETAPATEREEVEITGEEVPAAVGGASSGVVEAILSTYSAKEFVDGQVTEEELDQILRAGAKAPSARNLQPWHFTVVRNPAASLGMNAAPQGGIAIVISGLDDDQEGMDVSFDCGLATANMYLAAQSLGLGAHIYMGGVREIAQKQDEYQIPGEYRPLMILLVAQVDPGVDAAASASTRNPLADLVNYVD